MDRNLKKTLIHEIGHYVARTLNQEIYNIGQGVESIELEKKNALEYEGRINPIKPKNYKISDPVVNLTEYIAVLYYGCVFQSLFLDENLSNCFAMNKNGEKDLCAYASKTNDLSREDKVAISIYIRDEYIPSLKKVPDHLNLIFEKEYSELLIKQNYGYSVNNEKLRKELEQFFEEHSIFYKRLINKIRTVINER